MKLGWGTEDDQDDDVLDLTQLGDDDDEDGGVTSGGDSGLWLDDPLAEPPE